MIRLLSGILFLNFLLCTNAHAGIPEFKQSCADPQLQYFAELYNITSVELITHKHSATCVLLGDFRMVGPSIIGRIGGALRTACTSGQAGTFEAEDIETPIREISGLVVGDRHEGWKFRCK